MPPIVAIGYQWAQAFGLVTMIQQFFAALFALAVIFAAIRYFQNR